MGCMVEISAIVRMIRECAPETKLRVTTHSISARRGTEGVMFARGEGKPKKPDDARGEEHERVLRKVVQKLGISPECASRHFPSIEFSSEDAQARSNGKIL